MTGVKASTATARRPRGRPDEGARDRLVEAATELFIERDFDAVPTEEIIRRAGVSRGALYHHFAGKLDLFAAVYEKGEGELVARFAEAAVLADSPFDALVRGTHTYLRECETSPYLRRIGLRQSRTVLGWEGWRRLASRHGLGLVTSTVQAAMDAGELRARDPELTAHLILSAVIEGALLVVAAEDPAATRAEIEATLADLLDGLRAPR